VGESGRYEDQMKIAILSDVHGNQPALNAVMKRISELGCERIYCLGDVFGYFPDGQACFTELVAARAEFLLGNHEAMLMGLLPIPQERESVYRLSRDRAGLTGPVRDVLGSLLPYRSVKLSTGKRILMVHGSPWNPLQGYVYPDADLSRFGSLPYDCAFMGHTHRAFMKTERGVRMVNPGSCGLPRDNARQAGFAMYDSATDGIELVQVPMDVDAVLAAYPDVHPTVAACLRRP
jgi:predicted phosphodiesterase